MSPWVKEKAVETVCELAKLHAGEPGKLIKSTDELIMALSRLGESPPIAPSPDTCSSGR